MVSRDDPARDTERGFPLEHRLDQAREVVRMVAPRGVEHDQSVGPVVFRRGAKSRQYSRCETWSRGVDPVPAGLGRGRGASIRAVPHGQDFDLMACLLERCMATSHIRGVRVREPFQWQDQTDKSHDSVYPRLGIGRLRQLIKPIRSIEVS